MAPSSFSPISQLSAVPPTPESDTTVCSPDNRNHYFSPSEAPPDPSPVMPQKRKAGRKPLYKTAQERRDRNRRAQLAFRARRSDYLTRLEETCRSLEGVVVELQESNRVANDALNRERSKVKYLERLLQRSSSLTMRQHPPSMHFSSTEPFSVPVDDSAASMATHGVCYPSFPNDRSLTFLEQQFSPASQSTNLSNALFPQNLLGLSQGYDPLRTSSMASVPDTFSQQSLQTPLLENLEYQSSSASSPSPFW